MTGNLDTATWCRCCGAETSVQAGGCPHCGVDLSPATSRQSRIGQVVIGGRALFKKLSIAVADEPAGVTVVGKNAESVVVPHVEFDAMRRETIPGPEMRSPAGHLWRAVKATADRQVRASWSIEHLDGIAWDVGRRSLPDVRASILDRLDLGLPCEVGYLPVSPTELAWYRAWAAAHVGDATAVLEQFSALPPTGYERRCDVILAMGAAILDDGVLCARAIDVIAPLAATNATARAMLVAFSAEAPAVFEDLVTDFASTVADATGAEPTQLIAVGRAIATRGRVPAVAGGLMPHVGAWDAYVAGRDDADLTSSPEALAAMPLELVDELIECGAVTAFPPEFRPWQSNFMNYLLARVSPGTVDETVLRSAEFPAELARRSFLRSDRTALEALDKNDAAVAHYRALFELRDDPVRAGIPAGLRPSAVAIVEQAHDIARTGLTQYVQVPDVLLQDPTIWPLLRPAAERGHVTAANGSHPSAEPFNAWAALCVLQRCLFDDDMERVVSDGGELARTTRYDPFAAEALNMAAYACLRLGRDAQGLELLRSALKRSGYSTGLVVNAAIAAASAGAPGDPLGYLAQIVDSTEPSAIRSAAIRHAIASWREDNTTSDYPTALATLVRNATTANDYPDDLHRELLETSSYRDSEWLATATPDSATENRRRMNLFYQARARVLSKAGADSEYGYPEFCRVLVGLFVQPDLPDWLLEERSKNVAMLHDGVHTEYGKALGFALGIDVLVKGNALEFEDVIILGPQAAAHVASALDEDQQELDPEVEKRLVLDVVDLYLERRSELSERRGEFVHDDMRRCVALVTVCFWFAAGRQDARIADEFNALNERLTWDVQNRSVIQHMKADLLDGFDAYLNRGSRLLKALSVFTLEQAQLDLKRDFGTDLAKWSDENTRLRRNLP